MIAISCLLTKKCVGFHTSPEVLVCRARPPAARPQEIATTSTSKATIIFFSSQDDILEEEEDDDHPEAYRSRSLRWTNQYRKLIPYEKARQSIMEMGFTCKQDWDDYMADGKVYHGPYLPNHPDEMYADEWVSWDEFLGLMRPYDETRELVQTVLKLQNLEEYTRFIDEDPKRAEGLRIPLKPHIVYKDKGWISFEQFFGTLE